jgi:single-strand DNA-binding protein
LYNAQPLAVFFVANNFLFFKKQKVISIKRKAKQFLTEEIMNNLNSILLEGNLVRDPELKYTPKGTCVCEFSVASNRYYKVDDEFQKEVSFFEIITWSKLAQNCAEYLKKGRGVRVVGRLKQSRWTSEDGKNRMKISIVAEHVEFKPLFNAKNEDKKEPVQEDAMAMQAAF